MSAMLALLLAAGAEAPYVPAFDPAALKSQVAGPPNLVVVLGTPHLSGLPADFDPAHLEPLLARLAAWKPDIITIEAVSGPECEMMLRYKTRYPGTYGSYCRDPGPAQKALGLDMAAATAEADRRLAAWPARSQPADRRHLAALFLAGGEPASALVQWLRLPAAERRAGDGLDEALVSELTVLTTRRNEDYLIAAALAARLGLERVHAADDHSADAINASLDDDPGFEAAMRRAWNNPVAERRKARDAALTTRLDGEGVLALYRDYNRPETAQVAFDSDFGAALADPSPEGYGRRYVGWWEARNLRMVANIRAAIAAQPGSRTLSIVGVSHKGYFEAYLHRMHDIRLVDAETVLQ